MPVIVESVIAPSAADQADLLKIYNDTPDWLKQGETPDEWLTRILADDQIAIYAGRFNDRLLVTALVSCDQQQWVLDWLTVRKVTRNRGVGKRIIDVLQQLAADEDATLVVKDYADKSLPSWLKKLAVAEVGCPSCDGRKLIQQRVWR